MTAQLQAQALYLASLAASTVRVDSDRVFISDMYEHMVTLGEDEGMSLSEFKTLLLECHVAGLLTLTRCDLPMAYSEEKVAKSVTLRGRTEYHFMKV
jgi:hypothetical protein